MQTKQVLGILARRGVSTNRESLATMSDALGLRTRKERANWVPRRWAPEHIDLIAYAFRLRRQWNLDINDLRALLEHGDQAVADLVGEYTAVLTTFSTLGRTALVAEADYDAADPPELDAVGIAARGAA